MTDGEVVKIVYSRPGENRNNYRARLATMVFESLNGVGGVEYLKAQAKANPRTYLSLVAKLIPKEHHIRDERSLVDLIAASYDPAVVDAGLSATKQLEAAGGPGPVIDMDPLPKDVSQLEADVPKSSTMPHDERASD